MAQMGIGDPAAGNASSPMTEHRAQASGSARMPLIALTGATGFIGQYFLHALPKRGYRLRVLLRRPSVLPQECASAVIGDLTRPTNMAAALADVDAVIHTAGLSPEMSGMPEDDHRGLNTEATIAFARAAQRAGVKRFVFLSSIRAQTGLSASRILTEDTQPQPVDGYGRSKLAGEQGLARLDMDWVALRLVLVYGPGVKGNMARLLDLARSPYPLPLGALKARRSLLSIDNLVEAVDRLIAVPEPLRRPLIVADPEPLTIADMIAAMRQGLGRRPGLFPVPGPILAATFRAFGRRDAYQRLSSSLVVDPSALMGFGWAPPVATRDGLAALARG